jgi:hypothetical protein
VEVVGHETVRKDCESLIVCGSKYFSSRQVHVIGFVEPPAPLKRAESQEISIETDVAEGAKALRAVGVHGAGGGKGRASQTCRRRRRSG